MNKVMEKTRETEAKPVTTGWHGFEGFRNEVGRLFRDIERGGWWTPGLFDLEPFRTGRLGFRTMPDIDVTEGEKTYEITAELPGLDEKDVEVTVAEGVLTIRGEKKEETREDRKGFHVSERRFGKFERTFRLPEDAEAGKIGARFDKGVLTVTMPRNAAKRATEKKIEVRAA